MSLHLNPLRLVTSEDDYQVTLPMQLIRAEAKILVGVLQQRLNEEEARHGKTRKMHETLRSKLVYYITDTPLP